MDNKKNGIPKLRFPGFTGAWEQRKLGEVAKKITKGTTPHDKSWSGPVNYVKTESIDSNNGNISVIANTSLEEHEGYLKRSQLKENDVLFSIVGTLGRVGVVKKKDLPANTNQQICIIRPLEENSFFLLNALKTNRVKSFIKSDATIGAQPSLSLWQIEGLRIPFPNLEEQQKISAFFVKLDSLIALHQRKLEHLQEQKKGLLQKMFPKNGETVPEVRFPGFTDAWEQRKLGEILKERKERSSIGELISVTINNGVVKADSLERKDNSSSDKSNYKVVCKGDIAYNSMRMWQGASGYSPYNGILSPAYTVLIPTEKVDSKFISYMFKKEKMLQQFQKYSQGLTSDTWNLKYPMLKDIPVLFPKIDEQVSIRKHLDNISSLIALHQRKLDHLELMKKGLLQQMFV